MQHSAQSHLPIPHRKEALGETLPPPFRPCPTIFFIGHKRGALFEWLGLKIAGNKLANLFLIGSVQREAIGPHVLPVVHRRFKLRRQTVDVLPQYLANGVIQQYGTWQSREAPLTPRVLDRF